MERIPTTRRQRIAENAGRIDENIRSGINRGVHRATQIGFVQRLQRVVGIMETFINAMSFSAVLIYDILKYAFIIMSVILALIGVYYALKYVLLFVIWIQNFFI